MSCPYATTCMFAASGSYVCPHGQPGQPACPGSPPPAGAPGAEAPAPPETFYSQPAWVDADAKKGAWAQRSAGGLPLPATELQDKGHESWGRVSGPAQSSFLFFPTANSQ